MDVDGRVHWILDAPESRVMQWLPGHVDARMRNAKPVPHGTAITCLTCIYEWDRHVAFQREYEQRWKQR